MGSAYAEQIEALLSSPLASGDGDLKLLLTRLASEAKVRLANSSDSSDFFSSALLSISRIKGSVHADIRMQCLWDCAQYFYLNGQPEKALISANALGGLAKLAMSSAWLRKATMMIGVAHADNGNVAEALLSYARALDAAQSQNDIGGQVSVLANTGVALNYGALYGEAIPYFRKAIELARQFGFEAYLPRILINLAQSYHHLEEIDEAYKVAKLAVDVAPEPTDIASALSAITREFTFVQLALEKGKLKTAREHARVCASHARWCNSRRAKALSDVANGLCEVHGGSVDRGLALLEAALDTGGDIDSIRSAALIALVKANDAAARPAKALEYLSLLMEHKKATRGRAIATLLGMPSESTGTYISGEIDLRGLELREAQLRVSVAERELSDSRIEMLERLAVTADLKEESSGEHGYRVGKLSALLAEEMNWSSDAREALEIAARLHDIGKLGVPDRILFSSTELKDTERHFISSHSVVGAELLGKSNIPQLRTAEEIARYHHEWWNGEGYPSKLAGKRIPIHARIVALADVFDALTHGRPFAKPWPIDQALDEIRQRKGTQFDPELTDVFLDLIARLRVEHDDLDEFLGRAGRNSPFLQARNKIRLMLAEERENEKRATVTGNETRH